MKSSTPRPNILFAFADDWGRYASAYAALQGSGSINELISTPHFDRVARDGVLFTNAVVPAPSCTPCRSAILSGRHFWETGMGAILEGARWDESIPSYPLELERAGYHIGYSYKVWSPGRTLNAPYGAERTRYEPRGNAYNRFSHWVTEHRESLGLAGAKQQLFDETGGNFAAFLDACPEGAPFCFWWGPMNTHRTWERGSGRELWGLDPDLLEGRLPAYLPDVPEIREDFNDYLGECLAVDAGLGALLRELEGRGLLDDTLVVVSGDHGIPGIPRGKCNLYDLGSEVALAMRWPGRIPAGQRVDDVVSLMDLAPTFLEASDTPIPQDMSAESLLPLVTGERVPGSERHRSYAVLGRERHVAAARDGQLPYPQRAVRTRDFLYIRNYEPDRWPMGNPYGLSEGDQPPTEHALTWDTFVTFADMDASPTKAWMVLNRALADVQPLYDLSFGKRPAEELYDLRTDPDHMHNLAKDPAHEPRRRELAALLESVQRRHKDPRLVESPCRYEHSPYAGPID